MLLSHLMLLISLDPQRISQTAAHRLLTFVKRKFKMDQDLHCSLPKSAEQVGWNQVQLHTLLKFSPTIRYSLGVSAMLFPD